MRSPPLTLLNVLFGVNLSPQDYFLRLQVLIQIALLIWVSLSQSVQDGCTPILGWLCLAPAVAVLILEWLCAFFGTLGIAGLICSPTVRCSSLTVTSLVQDLGVHLRKSAMHPPSVCKTMFGEPKNQIDSDKPQILDQHRCSCHTCHCKT